VSSVQWPVSFVISLILDDKDANVVNIWNHQNVEAGNDLVLRLKVVELPRALSTRSITTRRAKQRRPSLQG
jgi:hypothetical protein